MTFSCWRFQFDTGADAERFLESAGFSIGRLQRDAPRGLMLDRKSTRLNSSH